MGFWEHDEARHFVAYIDKYIMDVGSAFFPAGKLECCNTQNDVSNKMFVLEILVGKFFEHKCVVRFVALLAREIPRQHRRRLASERPPMSLQ